MPRDILTPITRSDARKAGIFSRGLRYRKQILPQRDVAYIDKEGKKSTLNFDQDYLEGLVSAFESKIVSGLPFVLANDDNEHNMNPENFRAKVEKVELAAPGEQPGLYATLAFPNAQAARSIMDNPDLGVSVRIQEDVARDGKHADRAIMHVLGTFDPQVTGMEPWRKVDLSGYTSPTEVIDLSDLQWKGNAMPKRQKATADIDLSTVTAGDIDSLTEEQVDEILGQLADEIDAELEESDSEDGDEDGMSDLVSESDDEEEEAEEEAEDGDDSPELSAATQRQIDLANSRATEAEARATRALQKAADSDWARESLDYARAGVPKALVDLAAPFLHRIDPQVIDLSNGKKLDGSAQVRKILDACKGMIDLSGPQGFRDPGEKDAEEAKDKAVLNAWDQQYPSK